MVLMVGLIMVWATASIVAVVTCSGGDGEYSDSYGGGCSNYCANSDARNKIIIWLGYMSVMKVVVLLAFVTVGQVVVAVVVMADAKPRYTSTFFTFPSSRLISIPE